MNKIRNAIKCAICQEILESPVILPCNDIVCKKHVSNQDTNVIRCENCGAEHQISTNSFQPVVALQKIIETEIANLDLGNAHKEAKKSCESFEEALKEFEVLLKDPYSYTHERISELKNSVQLKGEELKLRIDQEMKNIFDRLEEYEKKSKDYLSSNEIKVKSQQLENEIKCHQSNLDSWLESLNKFNEKKWKSIKEESDRKIKCLIKEAEKFKNKLLLKKFDENQKVVDHFKRIKIDPIFEYVSVKWYIFVSTIINEVDLSEKLEDLLKNKELNDRNWSLLYRGSRDGFLASDFHSRCDGKSKTLTIVKSASGNIFGGFASAQWKSIESFDQDNSAFVFSLVNKENRPLIFEHSSNKNHSICSFKNYGPIFGGGSDILISDNSNDNTNSYSNLGYTYTHPEYRYGSDEAIKFLAGTYYFQVQEIEIFQMQP